MKNRPSQATRRARLAPLDHLKPGSRPPTQADDTKPLTQAQARQLEGAGPTEPVLPGAEPADSTTPGSGDADAVRGKATRSPASVATRRHLEGSEQGPQ